MLEGIVLLDLEDDPTAGPGVGRAPGKMSNLGVEFDAIYGDTADYEFASEQTEGAPKGRG